MSGLSSIVERIRGTDLERALGLRPPCPSVALEVDRHELCVVRLKSKKGRGRPTLEAHEVRQLDGTAVPATIFDKTGSAEELAALIRQSFESLEIRPGRVSLVLPDNLAKIALLHLPERPPSRKQLEEVIRFKLHRAVPFRFSEASLTYQVLPGEGEGKDVMVLVALVRRALVEQFERALESLGARPGLIDLCTPNLLNLCRDQIHAAQDNGGDVALLNCAHHYFSLLIIRGGQLIFFRCKTYATGPEGNGATNGLLAREVAGSLSYYQEKLRGQGVGTLLVRTVAAPFESVEERLRSVGVKRVEIVDPTEALTLVEGATLDVALAQRIAPALGAALGRG